MAHMNEQMKENGENLVEDKLIIGVTIHVLKKPFTFEDKTYKDFTFNWDSLTGDDMMKIEHEMADDNEFAVVPDYSTSYLLRLAARAAGVNVEVIKHLPLYEAAVVRNMARDFYRRGA